MELTNNQSAVIIETSDADEITVNVVSPDLDGLSSRVCQAIAMKLMQDVDFQEEIMQKIEE